MQNLQAWRAPDELTADAQQQPPVVCHAQSLRTYMQQPLRFDHTLLHKAARNMQQAIAGYDYPPQPHEMAHLAALLSFHARRPSAPQPPQDTAYLFHRPS